jgi:glycosyltransferase involved in cell wall biosynthesis
MPVYNAQDYLEGAVTSVINQDFESFELLLMDDGSTDKSGKICDELAQEDTRIKVVHKLNSGMCQTRNEAISMAQGDYIAFCDNDDYMMPGFLSENYSVAFHENADCVRFGRRMDLIDCNGVAKKQQVAVPGRFLVIKDEQDKFNHFSELFYGTGGVWAGLYKRDFLLENNIIFNECLRQGFEDIDFNHKVYLRAKRIVLNPSIYYLWLRREGQSSSLQNSENHILGLKTAIESFKILVESVDLRKNQSRFIDDYIMSMVFECLVINQHCSSVRYAAERVIYSLIYRTVSNDIAAIHENNLTFKLRIAYVLLKSQSYRLLYLYLRLGVWVKRKK